MDTRLLRAAGGAAVLGLVISCGNGGGGPTTPPPAQTGTVSGTVSADGSGVSGAQIALSGRGSQTTNASGAYAFTEVPAGARTATLTLPAGFDLGANETLVKSVTVVANQTATVNWTLTPDEPMTTTIDTVRLSGTSFSPASLTVKVGSTVVWVNSDATVHTVTPDGHSQWSRTQTSSEGEVLRATINSAGEFDYFCEPHQSMGMTGTIVVEP